MTRKRAAGFVAVVVALACALAWVLAQRSPPETDSAQDRSPPPETTASPVKATQPPAAEPIGPARSERPGAESTWDRATLGSHADAVQVCADADPNSPRGVLRVQVTLKADGHVKTAEVTDPKFRGLDVATCVESLIAAQRFAPGDEGRRASHNFRVR